jgi:hypothetical protein
MTKGVISKFREKPKTKTAWWAMGLGLATLLGGPIMGVNAAVIQPMIEASGVKYLGTAMSLGLIFAVLGIIIAAFVTSMRALRSGERSWVVWVGFAPAILSSAFWVLMVVGEFVFPH